MNGTQKISVQIILMLIITQSALSLFGQNLSIEGFVIERGTELPIPFANIQLKGTGIGTVSDSNGYFHLSLNSEEVVVDSLLISHLLFDNKTIAIQNESKQPFRILLDGDLLFLEGITIRPGENPAWRVLRYFHKNKRENNIDNKPHYTCLEYAKTRFDLNHFTDKLKRNILVRPFDYIWDHVDTTEDGIKYLPLLMVERVTHKYHQAKPRIVRDSISGLRQVGLPGKKMLEFTEDLYFTPNMYDDFVVILGKNFASPLHKNFSQFYSYYLLDSMLQDEKVYRIAFRPKNDHSLTFRGEMLIDGTTYALRYIALQFDVQANVNFVRSYLVTQTYDQLLPNQWLLSTASVIGDFTVMENISEMTGFFWRKKSTFTNYNFNPDRGRYLNRDEDIVQSNQATERLDSYWEKVRQDTFSRQDKQIVQMIDRLENDPRFVFRKDLIRSIATGYIPARFFDIGNIYSFYSHNNIEGNRLKFALRNQKQNTRRLNWDAFGAYGFDDDKVKYGVNLDYNFGRNRAWFIGVGIKEDIFQIGRSFNQLPQDHLFSSWVQISDQDQSLIYNRHTNLFTEFKPASGLAIRASLFYDKKSSVPGQTFLKWEDENNLIASDNWKSNGFSVNIQYSLQDKAVRADSESKKNLRHRFQPYPRIGINWTFTDESIFNSSFGFHKIELRFRQEIRTGKWGFFKYTGKAGKLFGTVPYTHLFTPYANPLVFLDDEAFNLMNFMEYTTDEFVEISIQQHFDGYLFNQIPVLRNLKWRSFLFAKSYLGGISRENNNTIYPFPRSLQGLDGFYQEVGFGVENIFKIARIDFIWRLQDRNRTDVYWFLVKPSFYFAF